MLLIIALQYSGVDQWLATQIYRLHDSWAWQHSWLLDDVIHHGGRTLVATWLMLSLLLSLLAYSFKLFNPQQRLALAYICVASLVSIATVSGLKQISMLPCPWDVSGMGGQLHYRYLHELFALGGTGLQCFPAGHASGGYAMLSVYFALKIARCHRPHAARVSHYWLLPGLLVGGIFGLAQQLRGAHFLSHDLSTALLCWYCSYALWLLTSKWLQREHIQHARKLNRATTAMQQAPEGLADTFALAEKS